MKEKNAGKVGKFQVHVPNQNLTLRVPLSWSLSVAQAIVEIETRINKILSRKITIKKLMVNGNMLFDDDILDDALEQSETSLSVDIEDIEEDVAKTELPLSAASTAPESEPEIKSMKADERKIESTSIVPESPITVFIRTMYDGVSVPPIPVIVNRNAKFTDLKQAIAVALNVPMAVDTAVLSTTSSAALTADVITNKVLITAMIRDSKELTIEVDIDDDLGTLKDKIKQAASTWATYQNWIIEAACDVEFFVVGGTRFLATTGTTSRTTVADILKVAVPSNGQSTVPVQVYGTPEVFLDPNTCETWEIVVKAGGEGTNLALIQSQVVRGSGVVEIDNWTMSTQQRPAQSVADLKRILIAQYFASFVGLPTNSLVLTDSVSGKVLLDDSLTLRETGLSSRSVLVMSVPNTTHLATLSNNDLFAVDVCTIEQKSYTCYVKSDDSIQFLRSVVTVAIGVEGRLCQSLKLKNIVLRNDATMEESNIVRNERVSIQTHKILLRILDDERLITSPPLSPPSSPLLVLILFSPLSPLKIITAVLMTSYSCTLLIHLLFRALRYFVNWINDEFLPQIATRRTRQRSRHLDLVGF